MHELSTKHLVVEAEFHQFWLRAQSSRRLDVDLDGLDWLVSLSEDGRAINVHTTTVLGPVQVRARVLAGTPGHTELLDDVVEFSCIAKSGLDVAELTGESTPVVAEGGSYRIRVGRSAGHRPGPAGSRRALVSGAEEEQKVDEVFHVDVWEAPVSAPAVHRAKNKNRDRDIAAEYQFAVTSVEGRATALDAAAQIGNAITHPTSDLGRDLEGIAVDYTMRGTAKNVWEFLRDGTLLGCGGGYAETEDYDFEYFCWDPDLHPLHRLTGRNGAIRGKHIESRRNASLTKTWAWWLPFGLTDDSPLHRVDIPDSQVTFELQHQTSDAHSPDQVLIHLRHEKLPRPIAEAMATIWRHSLELLDKASHVGERACCVEH